MATSLIVIALGAAIVVVGLLRARAPWATYQELKAQQENVARYEAWRGGIRDSGRTGASVAIEQSRRRALTWAGVAVVGLVVLIAGFAIH